MAELVELLGFDFKDPKSLEDWGFNNFGDHEEIRQAIKTAYGKNLTDWQLYPVNWQDWDAYALRHQSAHNEMNSILGLPGTDLMGVDFKDQKQSESWHAEHFTQHQSARSKLGI